MPARNLEGRKLGDLASTIVLLEQGCNFQKSITVFIPCLNEEATIYASLDTVRQAAEIAGIDYEVHVFDDNSKDNSLAEMERFSREHPEVDLLIVRNSERHGVAENCFDSTFLARGRYHRLGWADSVDSVKNYTELFGALGTADVLVMNYETMVGKPFLRRVMSKSYARLVRLISGHKVGYFNGGNCMPTVLMRRYHVESRGFGFQADLLTRVLDGGASYKELKLVSTERQIGSSSAFRLSNWLSVAWMLVRMIVRRIKREFNL
jgi:glycosyltransferase involved in cell wall biosynthesis